MRAYWFCCLALVGAAAQAQMKIPAVKLDKAPVIDGVLSEGEWSGASYFTGFIDLQTSQPVKDQTEVWIAYDKSCVYIAVKAHESDMSKLVANETKPGALGSDDHIWIYLDPFKKLSYSAFNTFAANPKGTPYESIAGGRSAKREWIGEWQVKTTIQSDGWTSEFRIPWKIMDLPKEGKTDAAILVSRSHVRQNLESWSTDLGPKYWWDRSAIWQGVEIPSTRTKSLFFQGYLSGESNEDGNDAQVGLDLKYKLTPRIILAGTVNPDFRNIEQSVAGIEFTRQERYLSDNRPFFSEGAGFFGLSELFGTMFYSRRIGEFDFGAKAYGNIDDRNQIGALVAQEGDAHTDALFSYNHQYSPRSWLALYGVTREDPEVTNRTIGGRISYGKGQWMGALAGAVLDNTEKTKSAGSLAVSFSPPDWSHSLLYKWIEPGFSPALGYVAYTNIEGLTYSGSYSKMFRNGPIRYQSFALTAESYDYYDGSNQIKSVVTSYGLSTKNNIGAQLGLSALRYEEEDEHTAILSLYAYDTKGRSAISLYGNAGERAGETQSYLSLAGSLRLKNGLDIRLSYSQQSYIQTYEQTILTLGWQIDPKRTLTARSVYSQGKTNAYLTFKSAGFTGMDWYLIVGDPNALEWKDRIVAKLVWAW